MKRKTSRVKQSSSQKNSPLTVFLPIFILGLIILPLTIFTNLKETILGANAASVSYTAGVTSIGPNRDYGRNNVASSTQVVTGANDGVLNSVKIYVGSVQAAPYNHMQVAVYRDSGSNTPGALLTTSATQVLNPNAWNAFPLNSSPITANTKYWLAFNTDGKTTQFAITGNTTGQSAGKTAVTYGLWPNPLGTLQYLVQGVQYSIYMTYVSVPTPTVTPTPIAAITNLPSQPGGIIYADQMNIASTAAYAHPGAMVVAGRMNYQQQAFKDISTAGGTVLMYIDPIIDSTYGKYATLLLKDSVCGSAVPRWPGSPQANSWGYLNDFRVGSIVQQKLSCVLEQMVVDNPHMAGFFVDDVGSRSWFPNIDWKTWSATDQQAYRDGAIAITQTVRNVADKHGLVFIVNGTWTAGTLASNGGGYPDLTQHGNALADGGVVEHHTADQLSYWKPYACSKQWAAQSLVTKGKSLMFDIASTDAERDAYAQTGCYSHIAVQKDYNNASLPWGTFHFTGFPSKVSK